MCSKKNKKPMYCIKCGTKQEEGEKFCPKCGTPFIVEDNFVSESESEINLKQEANKDFKVSCRSGSERSIDRLWKCTMEGNENGC